MRQATTMEPILCGQGCAEALRTVRDALPPAKPRNFNVGSYGAKGDGKTPDTAAIQSAIDACSAAGGGTVLLPAGRYLSGTLSLASNLRLEIAEGATLLGSMNLDDYASPAKDGDGNSLPESRWHRALLRANGATNLTLCGSGAIDGGKPVDPQGEEKVRGPHLFVFDNCSNVVIEGVTFLDAGNYAVFFTASDDVSVRRARFLGGYDGVHFRGRPDRPCRRVSISDCDFQTGDDSIAGMYWEGVGIQGCKINSSCNGLRLIGPASDLTVSRCDFHGPGHYEYRTTHRHYMLAAFCLQPGAWGDSTGMLDHVRLSDCTVRTVTTPFHLLGS